MTKKITIEVPETWADVVPGTVAADQVVEGIQQLIREQLPTKYERWKEETAVMKNPGYLDTVQRQLAEGAPGLVGALVMARRVLAGIVDDECEASVRCIDDALHGSMPRDVVEEIRSWNPIRGQVTEISSRD